MRLKKNLKIVLITIAFAMIRWSLLAQDGTPNVFTPYSFYGVGTINTVGTAALKSMGGAGVAYRSAIEMNILNPASYSLAAKQSFLLSFGMQGENNYLKSGNLKNSHNGFNLNDVGLMFRIANRLGFGFSITPYSSVGYRINYRETNPDIIGQLGDVRYLYSGSGEISLMKAGLGFRVSKGLSIGANFLYYLGSIEHFSQTSITPFMSNQQYSNTSLTKKLSLNQVAAEIGVQYNFFLDKTRYIILGATYHPQIKSTLKTSRSAYMYEANYPIDTIYDNTTNNTFILPHKAAFGIGYKSEKLSVSLDYDFQKWEGSMASEDGITYTNTHEIRGGMEYTPNRYDIRNQLKRWTYRIGFRYGNSYIMDNGHNLKNYAISLGVGVPIQKNGFSLMNIGAEFGKQGTTQYNMISNRYVKLYVGFSLFANNEWFVKHKFK